MTFDKVSQSVIRFSFLSQNFRYWKEDKDMRLKKEYRKKLRKEREIEENKKLDKKDKESGAQSAFKSW